MWHTEAPNATRMDEEVVGGGKDRRVKRAVFCFWFFLFLFLCLLACLLGFALIFFSNFSFVCVGAVGVRGDQEVSGIGVHDTKLPKNQ